MAKEITRRAAMGLGVGAATLALAKPAHAEESTVESSDPVVRIRNRYAKRKAEAGGTWMSHLARVDDAGLLQVIVDDAADTVTNGYSVQKVAVAMAVMDKVDRGLLTLDQKLTLQSDIILGGSGIYHLHGVYGDQLTIANFLTAMLLTSDNTAVRLCGLVCPALELNDILAAKGFAQTRVIPVANPNRFFLGVTTPRETHDLLWRLANKTLLSPASCDFLLRIMRWVNGYHDGIRRNMSSTERSRVATKYGADFNTLGATRNEVGIMFGTNGAPLLTYAFFANALPELDNYGATHPAVQAHAKLGRVLLDNLAAPAAGAAAPKTTIAPFRAVDGG
jgi:beta-lactamase class A